MWRRNNIVIEFIINTNSIIFHCVTQAILDGEEEVRQWLDYGDVPLEKVLISILYVLFTVPACFLVCGCKFPNSSIICSRSKKQYINYSTLQYYCHSRHGNF